MPSRSSWLPSPGVGDYATEHPLSVTDDVEGMDALGNALVEAEQALECARKDEWETVAGHDARCRQWVNQLTTDGSAHIEPERLAEGLARIREHYRELLALAEARRDRLAEAVRTSARGRAGTRAYEDNR